VHAFVWWSRSTDLLKVVRHLHSVLPGYMEETRDSGIGLKGTIDFEPPKYGETNASWAAVYAGIRVEHKPDSYPEVLRYDMTFGDSALASTCGHVKEADPAPIVFGLTPADLFPVRSRKAASVMHELGYKYMCFDLDVLLPQLSEIDWLRYETLVLANGAYHAEIIDLRAAFKAFTAKGKFHFEPTEDRIKRYAAASFEEHREAVDSKGLYYDSVKDIDLPGSLHTTTNARRYEVAAGVAKTATGIRWMPTASPAAPHLQLRLDPQTGSPRARPEALGPWVGPRLDEVREPRPPVGPAPPAGRQPKALEDWWPRAQLIDRLAPQAPRGLVAFYLWATLLQSAIASGRT
jgi:hypothetical protein